MSDHPIESMMNTTMEKIKTDGRRQHHDRRSDHYAGRHGDHPGFQGVLWVCFRRFGFCLEERCRARICSAAGRALGSTLTPVAFLGYLTKGSVKLLQVDPL